MPSDPAFLILLVIGIVIVMTMTASTAPHDDNAGRKEKY